MPEWLGGLLMFNRGQRIVPVDLADLNRSIRYTTFKISGVACIGRLPKRSTIHVVVLRGLTLTEFNSKVLSLN